MNNVMKRAKLSFEIIKAIGIHMKQCLKSHWHIAFFIKRFVDDTHTAATDLALNDEASITKAGGYFLSQVYCPPRLAKIPGETWYSCLI